MVGTACGGKLNSHGNSLEKTLLLGKIEGRRRRGQQRIRWLDGITNTMDMGLGVWGGVFLSFSGCGRKPWVPSTCTGDLRELLRVSIESVMPSNHLIPCCPLLLLPSIFPSSPLLWEHRVLATGPPGTKPLH